MRSGRRMEYCGASLSSMKLIIQIPCFNEEQTLPLTLADLPREVPGFDAVEWLVIDDGSSDRTIEVARAERRRPHRQADEQQGPRGRLPGGPRRRAEARRRRRSSTPTPTTSTTGATSRSSSRRSSRGDADMVVGDRQVETIEHFSPLKKLLQKLGSWVVRQASATTVPDTTSGFRAYNREAALQMQVVSQIHLHAGDDHPGGQAAGRRRPRPDPHEREDARVAPVPVDGRLRAPQRRSRSSASTRSTSR